MMQHSSHGGTGRPSSVLRMSISSVMPRSSHAALLTCNSALKAVILVRRTEETDRCSSYTRSR